VLRPKSESGHSVMGRAARVRLVISPMKPRLARPRFRSESAGMLRLVDVASVSIQAFFDSAIAETIPSVAACNEAGSL
jgi:hypothetical protein